MNLAESDLKIGDRVVYPNQGVCRVVGTTEMEIAGRRETFVKLSREDDEAIVMVPQGRLAKVGLRRVADAGDIKKVFEYLAAPVEGPELDWKVRHRTHGEMMSEGGLLGLARVVKGLTTLSDLRPLPPKERELYDNARHLLVSEIAASAGITEVTAEDAVDVALFPPGVVRQKPSIAAVFAEAGVELGLGEEEIGAGLADLGEDIAAPDLADLGEETAAEEGEGEGEAEAEGEEAEAGAEAEEGEAKVGEEPEPKPRKAAAKKAAAKPAKKPKAEAKPKAKAKAEPKAKAPKAAKAEKAEKPKKAKAAAAKAPKAAKSAAKKAPAKPRKK